MKSILVLSAIVAFTYAAVVNIPLAMDVEISYAEGTTSGSAFSVHRSDKYTTNCCSASNSYYIFAGFNIASLAGLEITSAEIQFADLLAVTAPQNVAGPNPISDVIIDLYNSTSFRESPPYTDRNDAQLPVTDKTIGSLNVTVATRKQANVIDVTSTIKEAVAAKKSTFQFAYGNSGGISASITVAAREANPNAIVIKVTTKDGASTPAPSSSAPTSAGPTTLQPGAKPRPSTCWTCKPGFVHWALVPNAPGNDECGCADPNVKYPAPSSAAPTSAPSSSTAAPTTTTAKPDGSNISGNNNARTNDAIKAGVTGIAAVAAVAAGAALL